MMQRLHCLTFVLASLLTATASAQDNSDWYRHTAISPDGKAILFTYKGDVYTVASEGGQARALTIHSAWEGHPVWSRDGKQIAFASDRHGNLDVFVMPATGGKATRLTKHSAHDVPSDFAVDGSGVLFKSARTDTAATSLFPTGRLAELYEVRTAGGTPRMLSTIPASEARYSADGKQIAYRDEKAYEIEFRKHDVSAFARDIWLLDVESGKHTQLTDFAGGDHNPVFAGDEIFYLSEDGTNSFNVWRMDSKGGSKKQVSKFKTHPVRNLSVSTEGTLAYSWHGSIYTHKSGEEPKRIDVSFHTDTQANEYVTKQLTSISEFAVSPNGKEIAIVSRGEVFVTSRDFKTTIRVTNTPEQERSVSFHKDGRTLLYAGERGGKWKLYESTIADEREKYFFAATKLEEKEIYAAETESFQPVYSPDGEKIAFLAGRDEVQVLNRKTGDTNVALGKEHNYSYSDGDIAFEWSADSKWLIADYSPRGRLFVPNIGIFPADGSAQPVDISHSGYTDGGPVWSRGGNVVLWASARYGQRDHGSWGREFDVMAAFLNQDAFDKFSLSKEEYELAKELKEADKKKDDKKEEDKSVADIKINWDSLDDRTVRLTKNSADISQMYLTRDAAKLYYLKSDNSRSELWMRDFREDETKLVKKLGDGASFEFSADEKTVFFLSGGSLSHAKVDSIESAKPIAFGAVMELKPEAERAYMFEHGWRQIKDKFYKRDFHGIDWDAMKVAYAAKLPSIGHNRDLADLMAEMTGELNASHIGVSYRPRPAKDADKTASLGVLFDMSDTSGPLRIVEVLDKSPLKKAKSSIAAGMKLSAIDGVKLDGTTNFASLLNHKSGKRVRLSITREDGTRFDEVMIAISTGAESQLMYERWVKNRRELVEKLSGGRLGYVHVRGMNDSSFRVVYSEILGRNFDKEAIVVDTRWNGGGWLHNDLAKLLSGEEYVTMHVRGRKYHGDSLDQWNKPSILVMGEGNYSDAHAFPFTYNVLGIGEMVGMPVPGTMTAVWWETSLSGDMRVGVPQVGMKNKKGEYLENNQTEPDHLIKNDPESTALGEDKQIAKAVEVMLKQLDEKKSKK
jgi:Tol biopolymer transport system component/C-terminal processing protease CtpA/Prc